MFLKSTILIKHIKHVFDKAKKRNIQHTVPLRMFVITDVRIIKKKKRNLENSALR